ncbi:hypothetical protein [Nonomuraea sp. CA-141351]|uniref:hypothetical protein n=1 Tax=Nonomuraea sp. CA-141351 TaxID=3239996 RepID=UPI003D8C93F1
MASTIFLDRLFLIFLGFLPEFRIMPWTRLVTIKLNPVDGVAAGEGVAIAGPGVQAEGQVGVCPVIGVSRS